MKVTIYMLSNMKVKPQEKLKKPDVSIPLIQKQKGLIININ
jgi:hypothetical protein